MAARKGGLGKGLEALFADNAVEENGSSSVKLKISEIEPNRGQPRKAFDEPSLMELADSIAAHGVIQPLIVRLMRDGSYQLVAGERRWRAARMAGLDEVPVIIREIDDATAMEVALIENLQREDLNPIEEAEGIKTLMDTYGLTQDETARRIGRSRSAIANTIRLLHLPDEIKDMARRGVISAGHARALLAFDDDELMIQAAKLIEKKDLSVRDIEKLAKQHEGKGKTEKVLRYRDPYYDEVELSLTAAIGHKIKVIEGKKRNVLEVEFYDKEDLARIANLLGKEEF